MLFFTHLMLGIVSFFLVKGYFNANIWFFLVLLLGAILPDIDEYKSKINQWSGIIGKTVSLLVKHRGIFHSFVFALFLFFVISSFFGFTYGWALLIGYFSHLVGDSLTPMGVQMFYPFSKFKLKGPIKTGSIYETIILVGLIVLVVKEFV